MKVRSIAVALALTTAFSAPAISAEMITAETINVIISGTFLYDRHCGGAPKKIMDYAIGLANLDIVKKEDFALMYMNMLNAMETQGKEKTCAGLKTSIMDEWK